MAETHELRLKIKAGAAVSGAREITGSINAVQKAVRDLDRDAIGEFSKFKTLPPILSPAQESTNGEEIC